MSEFNQAHLAALGTSLLQAWEAGKKLIEQSPEKAPPRGAGTGSKTAKWMLARELHDTFMKQVHLGTDDVPHWDDLPVEKRDYWYVVAAAAYRWFDSGG